MVNLEKWGLLLVIGLNTQYAPTFGTSKERAGADEAIVAYFFVSRCSAGCRESTSSMIYPLVMSK